MPTNQILARALRLTFLALLAGAVIALLAGPLLHAALSQDAAPVARSAAVVSVQPGGGTADAPAPGVVGWVRANGASLVAILGAVVLLARLIVKLTPTPKDDSVLEKIVTVLQHIGLKL